MCGDGDYVGDDGVADVAQPPSVLCMRPSLLRHPASLYCNPTGCHVLAEFSMRKKDKHSDAPVQALSPPPTRTTCALEYAKRRGREIRGFRGTSPYLAERGLGEHYRRCEASGRASILGRLTFCAPQHVRQTINGPIQGVHTGIFGLPARPDLS